MALRNRYSKGRTSRKLGRIHYRASGELHHGASSSSATFVMRRKDSKVGHALPGGRSIEGAPVSRRGQTSTVEPEDTRPRLGVFSGDDPTLARRFEEELRGFSR